MQDDFKTVQEDKVQQKDRENFEERYAFQSFPASLNLFVSQPTLINSCVRVRTEAPYGTYIIQNSFQEEQGRTAKL